MLEDTPEFNPILKEGIAVRQLKHVESNIDKLFQVLSAEFPVGMTYEGGRRCTVQESYREKTRFKNGGCSYDIATSYFYMMRYDFAYRGVPLEPRYVYLPYVDKMGMMYISDSQYQVVPVLSDRRLTVDKDSIFIHPLRAKITIKRMECPVAINGVINQISRIPYSTLYHLSPEQEKLARPIKMECVLVHYLLCRHGFKGTFQKYLGIEPVVGTMADITAAHYPPEEWTIFNSNYYGTISIPEGLDAAERNAYRAPTIAIAVRNEQVDEVVKSYITQFFYIVDRFHDYIQPEYLMYDHEAEKRRWIIMLGAAVLSKNLSAGRLAIDFEDHIKSLNRYIDIISRDRFKSIGIEVDDLYDLFDLVVREADQWIMNGRRNLSSIYDKELNVIDYVLNPLTEMIVTMTFALVSDAKKKIPGRTSDEEVRSIIEKTMRKLKPGALYRLTGESGAVVTMNNPGDNRAFKTIMLPQIKSKKNGKRPKNEEAVLKSDAYQFHVSLMEITGHTNVTKTDPSGRERANMCMNLTEEYITKPHPDLKDAMEATQIAMYPHYRHLLSNQEITNES